MTDISKNIRHFRRRKALSQSALAEMLHVTRQAVSGWETGKTFPDLDMVVRLSKALDTDPNSLLYPRRPTGTNPRTVPLRFFWFAILAFLALFTFGAGTVSMFFTAILGGGAAESYIYPIYGGIILLAVLIILCTCVILEELRSSRLRDTEEIDR